MMNWLKTKPFLGYLGMLLTFLKPAFTYLVWDAMGRSATAGCLAMLFLIFFDCMDGVVFRWSSLFDDKKLTRIRRYANAVGDRAAVQAVIWRLMDLYEFPTSYYALICVREIAVVGLTVYSFATKRPLEGPNNPSRLAMTFDGFTAISWMLEWPFLATTTMTGMVIFGVAGLRRYWKTIQATMPQTRFYILEP